jgi:hypothetical protein
VITRTTIPGILTLAFGLMVFSYAGRHGEAETFSPAQPPETLKLGHVEDVYEPVTFAHQTHSLIAEDCGVCHHHTQAGQTPACGKCHPTSAASKESNAPELKDAYHGQCIGCHKEIEMGPRGCMECHVKKPVTTVRDTPAKKPAELNSEEAPQTLTMKSLENIYQPVVFSHGLHAEMGGDCATCHHHSPAGQTHACGECHGKPFNPENLNMPGLKGAYHLQCLSCHREMGSGPVGCTECHAKKAGASSEGKKM